MTNLEYFIKRYRNKPLLIDANLFIVLLVGQVNRSFIQKVKTTRAYTDEDYELLKALVKNFTLITTSHVLTEVSNLCEKVDVYYKKPILSSFSTIIENIIETPVVSKEVVKSPIFKKLGLTDSILYHLSKEGVVILTDDFELHGFLITNGAVAANINLFRGEKYIKRNVT